MRRLSGATLPHAAARRPNYDRTATSPGIVHLGLGAFARAHLAVYVDDLLATGAGIGHIVGVSLRNDDVPGALEPQDGLYTLATISGADMAHRVIGSVGHAIHAPSHPAEVRRLLMGPTTSIVTVTVTEKGYCIDPATRRLDLGHPDIVHDLGNTSVPRSLPGHLRLAALDRRANDSGPLTVLSLDNIPSNGRTLRSAILEMASTDDPSLAEWIDANVAFPCSMVDRMVPSTDEPFIRSVATSVGLVDAWPVRAESFSQWVVERHWTTPMPPWETVGVDVVDDVGPWETLKLRVLNGLHTTAAHFGLRYGLATVDAVTTDPDGRDLLERVAAEIADVVEAPEGADVDAYVAATLVRFENTGLGHRCSQIAVDTSRKLPQRLLDTWRDRRARGLGANALADALALWAWSTLGRDHRGERRPVDDPLADRFDEIAATHPGDPASIAVELVAIESVFGDLARDPELTSAIAVRLDDLIGDAPSE